MRMIPFDAVELTSGYLFEKQELNRKITIDTVYDRFKETGRIDAFRCDYKPEDDIKPHYFWDSDVAKWIEGAAYILKKHPNEELARRVDEIVELIEKNQGEDGYFNIYFTVVAPEERWQFRRKHELYCAGHLIEAAVALDAATGKRKLLDCMEKYADYIYRVFVVEKSAGFCTPGHEEIELALMRLYRHTGKHKYLDLAAHFINARGSVAEPEQGEPYTQNHLPAREQREAVGHAVRALYLYTGMASLARETGEQALIDACRTLWEDVTERQMYVTGALGATHRGEAFTGAFDLTNDKAYAETCAAIALMLFAREMAQLESNAKYADTIERAFYNGVLAGLSLDGASFFYENPLEIDLTRRRLNPLSRFSKTQRVACFTCSCCPPNLNRLLASLGGYVYGQEGDTLYVNQFVGSTLCDGGVTCTQKTDYPRNGEVKLCVEGAKRVAIRIPAWCTSFTLNAPYEMQNGYAVVENTGCEISVCFDMTPCAVFGDIRITADVDRLCVMRGPLVYCAEGVDNGNGLHRFTVPANFTAREISTPELPFPMLELDCEKRIPFEGQLYARHPPKSERAALRLIPYHAFANRGETDMLVWLHTK